MKSFTARTRWPRGDEKEWREAARWWDNAAIQRTEAPLSHSRMVATRRRKQKAQKTRARIAKQAKKLRKQNVKAGAGAPKEG